MTIKEVEKRVEITSANIRFYEREGLLSPKRNHGNNYREYSEEDIEQLQKIKFLRVLGVSVPCIRELIKGGITLNEVVVGQKETIYKEEQYLKELQQVCDEILEKKIEYGNLDYSLLDNNSADVKSRLQKILTEDTSQIELTPRKFNRYIGTGLLLAFLLDTIIGLVLSTAFYKISNRGMTYDSIDLFMTSFFNVMAVLVIISTFVTGLSTAWTAKMKPLCVNFVIAVICLPVFLILLYFMVFHTLKNIAWGIAVYFGLIAAFVFVFGTLLDLFEKIKKNCIYALLLCIGFSAASIGASFLLDSHWIFWSVVTLVHTIYISFYWIIKNRYRDYMPNQSRVSYNKYAGIVIAFNIVNVFGNIVGGIGRTKIWRRGEREFE